MKITIDLGNVHKIDDSIEAIQRVIDNKPKRVCDDTIFIDLKYILLHIKERSMKNVKKGII